VTGEADVAVEVRLARRWGEVSAALGWGEAGAELGAEIVGRYGEAWRRYHTAEHLAAVLEALDDLIGGAPPTLVELAAWFHDVVVDPGAGDNEERSRDLAIERLGALGVAPSAVVLVGELVMATKAHEPGELPGAAALLDADLSILGADPPTYDAYARAIREEHAHVTDDRFRAGRAAVLEGFLARDRLFLTPGGVDRYEAAARANLTRELAALRAG
jgi:predicted metal-dependent HD superfamily phosphohydrolase